MARDFEELPEAAVDSLRDSLMVLLLKYARWGQIAHTHAHACATSHTGGCTQACSSPAIALQQLAS